jgi:hypothetical protein
MRKFAWAVLGVCAFVATEAAFAASPITAPFLKSPGCDAAAAEALATTPGFLPLTSAVSVTHVIICVCESDAVCQILCGTRKASCQYTIACEEPPKGSCFCGAASADTDGH